MSHPPPSHPHGHASHPYAPASGPAAQPGMPPEVAQLLAVSQKRRRRIHGGHVLAGIIGVPCLALSLVAIKTTGAFAYAFPIGAGLCVAYLLTGFLPRWVAGIFLAAVAVKAVMNVRSVAATQRDAAAAHRLHFAIADVCDGKPLDRASDGTMKIRVFDKRGDDKYWISYNSERVTRVPQFVLCVKHTSQEVSCGDFVEEGKSDRGPRRICTSRDLAHATLRKTETAEIVFEKDYAGAAPEQLGMHVQLGGRGSTRLGGGDVSYSTIYPDIQHLLKP